MWMKNQTKIIIWLIVIVIVIAGIWWGTSRKSIQPPTAEKNVIKIGVLIPLTGKAANFGKYLKNGIDMAFDDYGKENIKLIYEDEACDPQRAVSAFRKLIDLDKVSVVIGAFCSSCTLAIAPIAEENKVVLITPGSAAETISEAGDFIFRNHIRTSLEMKKLGQFMAENYKNIAIFYDNTNDAMILAEKYLKESIIENEGEIINSIGFISGQASYYTEILKIKPDLDRINAIHIEALTKDAVIFVKELAELGINKQLSFDNVVASKEFIEPLGDLAEGVIFIEPKFNKEDNLAFWTKYEERYGEFPTVFSVQAYDSFMIVAKIMHNKCGNDSICLKKELYKVKDYQGAGGKISFDENGDVEKEVIIKTIKNGKFVPYKD
ncbi:MAG: hypothetical protein DRI61_15000 [Chloroflexi bacterium]|nr:MAG: hypothetical protein DRI61_15000 [Chloroflexota bacterium]